MCETIDGLYNSENEPALAVLAKLCGHQTIQLILEIFARKIITNLMHFESKHSHKRIVTTSLDVFSSFLINSTTQKLLSQIPLVRQLASAHINQFSILQAPAQSKQLGQFFRVLTGLWLSDDYISNFSQYLD